MKYVTVGLCEEDWKKLEPDTEPARFKEEVRQTELCGICGQYQSSGIYRRMPIDEVTHRMNYDTDRCLCGGLIVYFEEGDKNHNYGEGCDDARLVFPGKEDGRIMPCEHDILEALGQFRLSLHDLAEYFELADGDIPYLGQTLEKMVNHKDIELVEGKYQRMVK